MFDAAIQGHLGTISPEGLPNTGNLLSACFNRSSVTGDSQHIFLFCASFCLASLKSGIVKPFWFRNSPNPYLFCVVGCFYIEDSCKFLSFVFVSESHIFFIRTHIVKCFRPQFSTCCLRVKSDWVRRWVHLEISEYWLKWIPKKPNIGNRICSHIHFCVRVRLACQWSLVPPPQSFF